MLGMNARQATIWTIWTAVLLPLLFVLTACAPAEQSAPSPTPHPPTDTPEPTATSPAAFIPPPPAETSTPAAPACLMQPGRVEEGLLETTNPPQAYFIYLPPCYDEKTDRHYPVLYLLHGQTYTADQWLRIGAADALDNLIITGETQPFLIVFPDDRYWNLPAGTGFGLRLVQDLIPYIDLTYRTLPDRNHRAIGGMSRGAGWALRIGFTRWDLFSVIGLHSLAVLQGDSTRVDNWIAGIPPDFRPRIFMDIGDNDQELKLAGEVESRFNAVGLVHEWRLYSGAHTEEYWSAHVDEYIQWYAEQWDSPQ